MDQSLSNIDMSHYIPEAIVCRYPDFVRQVKSFDSLTPEHPLILLYELKERNGHWTCVFRRKNGNIEVFDSYGFKPDEQLMFVPSVYAKKSRQNHTHLINLLLRDGCQVEYNPHRLQKLRKNINTCGRHVISRLLFRDTPIEEYARAMRGAAISPDEIVTMALPKIDT